MSAKNVLLLFVTQYTFWVSFQAQTNRKIKQIAPDRFQVGQIWKYNNRPGEDNSTLTILKIERWQNGDTIIHIKVDSLKIRNLQALSGDTNSIRHIPILKQYLLESTTTLIGHTNSAGNIYKLYKNWRDTTHAGYWKNNLKKVIDRIDKYVQKEL